MSNEATDEGYARGLKNRQISMMAIGGAIGTGLFLGAGAAIETSGPALIVSYAVAGAVIFLIMRALGELLMYRPVSRSFVDYAEEFVGRFAGFATGWVYWLMWVVTAMAEITAAGIYVQYWFPAVPQWVTAAVVLGVLFLANLISVKVFGEFEFWFSMIKVVTIVGAIVLGLAVIVFGIGPAGEHATFAHLVSDGGFLPHGAGSALLALQSVMFAYLGVELIASPRARRRTRASCCRRRSTASWSGSACSTSARWWCCCRWSRGPSSTPARARSCAPSTRSASTVPPGSSSSSC